MTGSTRLSNTPASSVLAPYSAPHAQVSPLSSAPQITSPAHLWPTANFDPQTGTSVHIPAPFVPREFRSGARWDVTVMPAAERSEENNTIAVAATEDVSTPGATSIAQLFSEEAVPASDFASFIESHPLDESETAAELPWIDAFAADVQAPEETWPLDEAGKRLNELTQSLSSLDASRERIEAARLSVEPTPPAAAAHMWSDEEWIDIMPTSPADNVPQDALQRGPNENDRTNHQLSEQASPSAHVNAESAARALEGLAQRVRAGDIPVPAFPMQLGQEAMLAGLLASMLGWHQ